MPTLVMDPPPVELQALIERRKRLDQDRHDEMWEGVLHAPLRRHARLQAQLLVLLEPLAAAASLEAVAEFNLGAPESWEKLPFYAAHHVDEILIVDPATRSVDWLRRDDHIGEYRPTQRSALIDSGPAALAEPIDWPAGG
jgi:hypothetical protein